MNAKEKETRKAMGERLMKKTGGRSSLSFPPTQ
jgi:hypothetical protein